MEELNAALSLVVSADKEQNFTEEQKAQARQNIGALSESAQQDIDQLRQDMDQGVLPVVNSAVTVNKQTLTDEQKATARDNIGAIGRYAQISTLVFDNEVAGFILSVFPMLQNGVMTLGFSEFHDLPVVLRGLSDGIEDSDVATVGQVSEQLDIATKDFVKKDDIRQEVETDSLLLADEEGSVYVSAESPEKDDEGYIAAGRVSFYAGDDDQQVILSHIHDGIDDTDAATVGQLKKAVSGDLSTQSLYAEDGLETGLGANIDFGESIVHGVNTPKADTDAANKGYVDQAIANAIANLPVYNGEVEEV